MWNIELNFNGAWITLATGYDSRDDAEWTIGRWKQANDCKGDDCFRTTKTV